MEKGDRSQKTFIRKAFRALKMKSIQSYLSQYRPTLVQKISRQDAPILVHLPQ